MIRSDWTQGSWAWERSLWFDLLHVEKLLCDWVGGRGWSGHATGNFLSYSESNVIKIYITLLCWLVLSDLFTNQNFVTYLKSGSIILSKTKRKNLVQFSSAKLIIMLLVSIIYYFAWIWIWIRDCCK